MSARPFLSLCVSFFCASGLQKDASSSLSPSRAYDAVFNFVYNMHTRTGTGKGTKPVHVGRWAPSAIAGEREAIAGSFDY